MGIFFSFELAAFELANKLITIASEHCIAFEHSLTKGRLGGIVDEVVQDRDTKLRPKFPETGFPMDSGSLRIRAIRGIYRNRDFTCTCPHSRSYGQVNSTAFVKP
jgi:hypothetical protein